MIGLSGCTSKGFDIERVYQFVEIQSSNGKEIGTIVNSDDLEFFFEEMKFQEWKYIEEKEDFGKCIYKFIAYEFVKDDEEYCIREDPYELYKVDDKERLDFKAPGWFRMTKNLLTTGEKSIVNFISEVQQVYYKETGISDYRLIPEAFWDKTLTRLGI